MCVKHLHSSEEGNIRVLLVDDDRDYLSALESTCMSEPHGAHHLSGVTLVDNGEEALEEFKKDPSYIVVTDVVMPGMGGIELAKKIHEAKRTAPIIALTGAPEEINGDRGLFSDVIRKGEESWVSHLFASIFAAALNRIIRASAEDMRQRKFSIPPYVSNQP